MSDDRRENRAEASERRARAGRMTTQFDPALRTDRHVLGVTVSVLLLAVALTAYGTGAYSPAVRGGLLVLALLVGATSFPYGQFRGET